MGHFPQGLKAIIVLLALATMVGCQGFSTKSNTQTQPPGALTAAPANVSFGNVQIGTSQSQSDTLTNTGGSSLTISQAAVTGTGYSITGLTLPLTLDAGQSTAFNVVFKPTSGGSVIGNLALTNSASSTPLNIALAATAVAGGTLTGSPTSMSFGNVQVGLNQSQTETLKNTGGQNLTVSKATFSGSGFSATGLTLPLTLVPNQSTTFAVVFAPTTAGAANSTLSLTESDSATTFDVALSGTGVAPANLTATPASMTFTNVQTGQSQTQTETVKNTGGMNAKISQATIAPAAFSISGLTTPLTLAPGQSASFTVTFAPQSAGNSSGNVMIDSDAADPALGVGLTGSAVAPAPGTLNVSSVNVGSVLVGTSGTQTGTLSATGASVTVSSVSLSGADPSEFAISGLTFPVTVSTSTPVTFTVKFTPSATGAASATATFASNAGNTPTAATLSGTGTATPATLTATPATLTFTNVQTGQSQTQTETVKNTGGSDAHISRATISPAAFSISGLTTPLTLGPGQSASFSVTFAPLSAGNSSGSAVIDSDATNPALSIGLTGSAVAPPPGTLSVSAVNVGSVVVGASGTQTGTLSATGASVTVSSVSLSGANPSEFSISGLTFPVTVTTSTPVTFTVKFTPTATGAASATATFASNAGNTPTAATLSGTGTATPATLTATPATLTFTNVQTGQSQTQTETVKNTGGTAAHISQATIAPAAFSISGLTTPLTLGPGQSTSFSVTFAPLSAGNSSGSAVIDSDATNPALSIGLTGSAVSPSQGTLSVSAVNVGSVVVGLSGTQTGTLSASGASVSVSSVSLGGADPSEFAISGLTFPVTVTTSTPVTFTVTYTPTSSGASSATASFASTATNTPTSGTLSGTGTPAPVHTVLLSWTASSTSGINSYNVYRALYGTSSCGSYSNIGSTAGTVTQFTDSVVTDGKTYCYATTAVDANGESAYSNIIQAVIPAP